MSTVPLRCPYCGAWLRVAAQASSITRSNDAALKVTFDAQTVAHICETKTTDEGDARSKAHTLDDCWCGMPHSPEDFL